MAVALFYFFGAVICMLGFTLHIHATSKSMDTARSQVVWRNRNYIVACVLSILAGFFLIRCIQASSTPTKHPIVEKAKKHRYY